MGYVLANRSVISKLTVAKQVSDVHTNLMYQMIACDMLTKYDIDATSPRSVICIVQSVMPCVMR